MQRKKAPPTLHTSVGRSDHLTLKTGNNFEQCMSGNQRCEIRIVPSNQKEKKKKTKKALSSAHI